MSRKRTVRASPDAPSPGKKTKLVKSRKRIEFNPNDSSSDDSSDAEDFGTVRVSLFGKTAMRSHGEARASVHGQSCPSRSPMAGRAVGAGAGEVAAGRAGGINEPPTRVQNHKNELVAKWKALSVASFDVVDALRAVSSNDNEKRDFLQTVVREAAHQGVLDGTPYISSLAHLRRGEDEVQEQPQPAEDLGGAGNDAAASAAAAAQGAVVCIFSCTLSSMYVVYVSIDLGCIILTSSIPSTSLLLLFFTSRRTTPRLRQLRLFSA